LLLKEQFLPEKHSKAVLAFIDRLEMTDIFDLQEDKTIHNLR